MCTSVSYTCSTRAHARCHTIELELYSSGSNLNLVRIRHYATLCSLLKLGRTRLRPLQQHTYLATLPHLLPFNYCYLQVRRGLKIKHPFLFLFLFQGLHQQLTLHQGHVAILPVYDLEKTVWDLLLKSLLLHHPTLREEWKNMRRRPTASVQIKRLSAQARIPGVEKRRRLQASHKESGCSDLTTQPPTWNLSAPVSRNLRPSLPKSSDPSKLWYPSTVPPQMNAEINLTAEGNSLCAEFVHQANSIV